jgi:tellurite resistance protein TehA-like permease
MRREWMTIEEQLAWGTGVLFLLLLLAIAFIIYWRGATNPVPSQAMLIFRIVLALAGAGFAAVLPGFLSVNGTWQGLALRAGGAFAAFVILYFFDPPRRVERNVAKVPPPAKRRVHSKKSIDENIPPGDASA